MIGQTRPHRVLLAMASLYAVLSVILAALFIWTDHDESLKRIESATADIANLLDEHASRTLDTAELALARVADHAGALVTPNAKTSAEAAKPLIDMLAGSPHLGNIYIVDADGALISDLRGMFQAGTTFRDRDWVKALRRDDAGKVFIGQAGFDEATRSFVFTVARRLYSANGAWIGAAAVTVQIDYFKRFYQKLDYGPVPALGIYRLDGAVLVRQPLKPEDIGRNMSANPIFTTHLPNAPSGTYQGRSAVDSVVRVVSYRVVEPRSLVVWVSVGSQEALAQWRERSFRIAALVVVSWLLMGALCVVLYRELMREHRMTADLEAANRDLQRSNADLEQFAYIASHDLKEPLRNIASYVQLLQRRYQGQLDSDADAFIGYTVEGVQRMQTIISELLSYSRVGTGDLTPVPVQAGILVSTALAHLKGVISEAQAVVEVDGQLPVIEGDAALLGSLFQNLISNALKYRREDVRAEVRVGCQDRGRDWAFYVADNGIGIETEYHRQIFDLFRRLHPRDRFAGTGIGLAICQRVVERHGGRIWVESVPGKGSTFWFTLPKQA
ncbi:Two-component sensor histidine kinase [Magnetospirillum sp. LM-5]|uniref:sensor histidine kinase n=1 Tax=Magnetospirillum sp. LM-5 TaxID=2681466 RepID=UPI001382C858|nr:ATP-binding protein [Magnetospirillum sp. LM-5]CAA7618032.1 Two-component sensor histidine kinase [Magnetospirillum sp. LM-5]